MPEPIVPPVKPINLALQGALVETAGIEPAKGSPRRFGYKVAEMEARCAVVVARERERTGVADSLKVTVDPSVVDASLPPRKRKRGISYRVRLPDGRLI